MKTIFHTMTIRFALFSLTLITILLPALGQNNRALPTAQIVPAASFRLPGGRFEQAGIMDAVDSNSPMHWDNKGNLYLFASVRFPFRSVGPNLFGLHNPILQPERVTIRPRPNAAPVSDYWLEATYRDSNGLLYGWYHFEKYNDCSDPHLAVPQIGALVSADEGKTWQDLGTVMSAPANQTNCNTANHYFANGNGDFSVLLDPEKRFFYFFYGSYTTDINQQGVAIARMAYADRNNPVGKVWRYYRGGWSQPGINGAASPTFSVMKDWHSPSPSALWGPSVHYNTYLQQYVMVLNHAVTTHWGQEGIYISYNTNLAIPSGWSTPLRLDVDHEGRAYPQIIGPNKGETDKLSGQFGRLFLSGESKWEIQFQRPNEAKLTTLAMRTPLRTLKPLDKANLPSRR